MYDLPSNLSVDMTSKNSVFKSRRYIMMRQIVNYLYLNHSLKQVVKYNVYIVHYHLSFYNIIFKLNQNKTNFFFCKISLFLFLCQFLLQLSHNIVDVNAVVNLEILISLDLDHRNPIPGDFSRVFNILDHVVFGHISRI